jgi:hypothetical protein
MLIPMPMLLILPPLLILKPILLHSTSPLLRPRRLPLHLNLLILIRLQLIRDITLFRRFRCLRSRENVYMAFRVRWFDGGGLEGLEFAEVEVLD